MVLSIIGVPEPAAAQPSASEIGQQITALAGRGASARSLWNYGYQVFNRYPPTPALASTIADGFAGATGINAQQDAAFNQAARHWRNKANYWRNRPVAWYWKNRPKYNQSRQGWESTLKMSRPKGAPLQYPRRRRPSRWKQRP